MAVAKQNSLMLPLQEKPLETSGVFTRAWEWFFRAIWERLNPLGIEKTFNIANNKASAADVTGLSFDKAQVSSAIVEFLIQRVTTSTGETELVEAGMFIVAYKPTSDAWGINLLNINSPDNSGVDFTITAAGQVQYTSTNITGTASISKMFYRVRTLAGKNYQYSTMARGR